MMHGKMESRPCAYIALTDQALLLILANIVNNVSGGETGFYDPCEGRRKMTKTRPAIARFTGYSIIRAACV
jgi:hypothetical protein